jgi:hypothetical protein
MRLAIICLLGAAVFVFPCAWDSDPHAIQPATAIFAKVSAVVTSPGFHIHPDLH